jgi:hypothetical protein
MDLEIRDSCYQVKLDFEFTMERGQYRDVTLTFYYLLMSPTYKMFGESDKRLLDNIKETLASYGFEPSKTTNQREFQTIIYQRKGSILHSVIKLIKNLFVLQ